MPFKQGSENPTQTGHQGVSSFWTDLTKQHQSNWCSKSVNNSLHRRRTNGELRQKRMGSMVVLSISPICNTKITYIKLSGFHRGRRQGGGRYESFETHWDCRRQSQEFDYYPIPHHRYNTVKSTCHCLMSRAWLLWFSHILGRSSTTTKISMDGHLLHLNIASITKNFRLCAFLHLSCIFEAALCLLVVFW